MALCPNTVASSGKPMDLYFALQEDIPAPQVLSQNGNTISLSGGGGSVNVASTTAVALSTSKLTETTYNAGLGKTSTGGQTIVLEPALEVRIEPKLEVQSTLVVQAVGGKVTQIDGFNGIYTTGDLKMLGTNPSVDFYNSSDVMKASLDYTELNDKITLTGTNITAETDALARVIMDAGLGIEVRTDAQPIKIQRYDAAGAVVDSSIEMTSTGVKPSQIVDGGGSVGAPGEYLVKGGGGDLAWAASAPGMWAGTALSDLNMNGFKIVDNTGNLNLQSVGTFNVALKNSAGDVVLEVGEDPLSVKQISLATLGGSKLVQTFNDTQIVGDTASLYTPTLRFIDANTLGVSIPITADMTNLMLQGGARKFQLFSGANGICSLFANENTGESGVEVEGGVDLQLRTNGAEVVGTIDSLGTPKSFRFGSLNNTLYLTNATTQEVSVDDFSQFTTTQCAVPRQIRDIITGPISITSVPLQTTPLYAGSTFSWLYSGNRNGSSAFCKAQRVEVEVDVILEGSLTNDFQFALSLYNSTTVQDILPENYNGVNAINAFTALTPAVAHTNTQFVGDTVFIKFASVFACSGNFTDGDQVTPRLWALSRTGTHTVNSGLINIRVRPLTVW